MGKKLDKAIKATGEVSKELMTDFNSKAKNPLVNGVGLDKDMTGYFVAVELNRLPTEEEKAKLSPRRDGVRVKYSVPVKLS